MKAYIQCSKISHMPGSDNFYKAYLAFYEAGIDWTKDFYDFV